MASLQERNGHFRILFRHHGKQHSFSLGQVSRDEAEAKSRQVDYLLMRLEQRLITLPDGVDIVTFLRFDGKPPEAAPVVIAGRRQIVTLDRLCCQFVATHANGTLEADTLATYQIHFDHLGRVLGVGFPLAELTLAKLQAYVGERIAVGVSPTTARMELATFRAAWKGLYKISCQGRWEQSLQFTSADPRASAPRTALQSSSTPPSTSEPSTSNSSTPHESPATPASTHSPRSDTASDSA